MGYLRCQAEKFQDIDQNFDSSKIDDGGMWSVSSLQLARRGHLKEVANHN